MPTYDLKCTACGREWERLSTIAARYEPCETCGGAVEQQYKHSVQSTVFVPYFDYGLGVQVNSLAERWTHMRRNGLQYRDLPSKGELSARADKAAERRKEEARG